MASHLNGRRARVSLIVLLLAPLTVSVGDALSQPQVTKPLRIEILIQDGTYYLEKSVPIQIGQTIEVVVRNHDPVRHGFASASLSGLFVSGEDDQIMTYGKGVEGFYVNPGKTLMIRIAAERPGSLHFHCDLHERMKGELYVLEVPTA